MVTIQSNEIFHSIVDMSIYKFMFVFTKHMARGNFCCRTTMTTATTSETHQINVKYCLSSKKMKIKLLVSITCNDLPDGLGFAYRVKLSVSTVPCGFFKMLREAVEYLVFEK